jgi:hypothetical protein
MVAAYLGIAGGLGGLGLWTASHLNHLDSVVAVLWWLAALAAGAKLAGAAWALRGLRRRGLVDFRQLSILAGAWFLIAGCLAALPYLLLPAGRFPLALIAFGLVLALPLTRLLGAPLALAWNRHR